VNTWPIASDVIVETKHWRGRMVVEDVEQFTTPSGVLTTTYTLRSLDGPPPLLFGMLRGGRLDDLTQE